jgi:putative salt-induced outer membrane protein
MKKAKSPLSWLRLRRTLSPLLGAGIVLFARGAGAQPTDPTGAPPPDAKALVDAPKAADAPTVAKPVDGMGATVSAGAQLVSGNSRLLAVTGSGVFDLRSNGNGFGAALVGNYGQGAPPGASVVETTENVQGRLRYDRYLVDEASVFLIATGRHDRFQGLDFRLNIDPGFKYLFVKRASEALWAEVGYDFQYDIRRDDALAELDGSGMPVLDASGQPVLLPKTATDHSLRFFYGAHHAFNEHVTLALGYEYLQSFIESTRYRLNFDVLFAAKVSGGLAVGFAGSARFDHDPLPGKERLDTTLTANVIYSFTSPRPPPAK